MASSGQRELTPREKKEIREEMSWDERVMGMNKRQRKEWLAQREMIQARRPLDPEDQDRGNVHPRRWSPIINRVPKWLQDILDLKPLVEVMGGWTEPLESWRTRHFKSKKSYVSTGIHVFEVTLPSEQEEGSWRFDLGFILKETRQFFK